MILLSGLHCSLSYPIQVNFDVFLFQSFLTVNKKNQFKFVLQGYLFTKIYIYISDFFAEVCMKKTSGKYASGWPVRLQTGGF